MSGKIVFFVFIWCMYFSGISWAAEKSVVLFDQGHGQRFLADRRDALDLSGLAGIFEKKGYMVGVGKGNISAETLSGVKVVVISGPFKPFSREEIDAIKGFLQDGGSLSVMLHIGPPVSDLLHALGVDFSNGVIRESSGLINNDPLNFKVTHLKTHQLTRGLKQFNLYGGWAVINTDSNSEIIAETGSKAWVDLDGDKTLSPGDAIQSFGVVVAGGMGKGRFVVFGDDAIFQNKFLAGDNMLLGKNLAEWLEGSR